VAEEQGQEQVQELLVEFKVELHPLRCQHQFLQLVVDMGEELQVLVALVVLVVAELQPVHQEHLAKDIMEVPVHHLLLLMVEVEVEVQEALVEMEMVLLEVMEVQELQMFMHMAQQIQ
jgi:hypothetical protein